MSIYRHNNTGKYFIILESEINRVPTEPNNKVDIILPFRKEVSETVGINSENYNDAFPISRNFYVADNTGAEDPLSIVPDFQPTLLKTIDSADALTSLETTSNTNMLGFRIKKGKLAIDPGDPSWPTLLNQLSTDPANSIINKSVSKLLAENNIYSPENPIVNGPILVENDLVLGTIQNKVLGEHGPRKFPNAVEDNTKNQITIGEMKAVGMNILLASTGGIPVQTFGEITEALQPINLVDNGLKVNFGTMKPSTLLSTVKPGYVNLDNNDSIVDNSFLIDSYGNANNPYKPFTGTKLQVSSPILFAKLVALSLALKSIIARFSIYGKTLGDHLTDGSSRDKETFLGSNLGNAGADPQAAALDPFDTPPITNDFFQSVEEGFKRFFGLNENFAVQVGGKHAGQSSKMYGYISIFARKLSAAINELNLSEVFAMAKIATEFTISQGISGEPPKTAEEEVERLRSNFAIKFIKVLSIIGDKSLTVRNYNLRVPVEGIDGVLSDIENPMENISSTDNRLNPAMLVVKHKLDSKDGALAYGNKTIESLLLVPSSIEGASDALNPDGSFDKLIRNLQSSNTVINIASNNRIGQQTVKEMEDYLEMDYMPFYFHDLRTNEIISFHAFLESATDNLAAEYNETEGYGRTGVIPIYKNTKRTISFTFKILATNQDDHEQMWYKVNRLAACLYPQFSEGRLLNDRQGNKFIQPFSQVFAASPLMRIRFGDLWKSNYSKLAVARLFGLAGFQDGDNATFELASTRQISVRSPTDRLRQQQMERNASREAARELQVGDEVEIRPTAIKYRWAVASRDNNVMGNPSDTARATANGRLVRIGEYIMAQNLFLLIPVSSNYVVGRIESIHRGRVSINYFVRVTNSRPGPSGDLGGYIVRGRLNVSDYREGTGEDPLNWVICVNPGALHRVVRPEPVITDPVVESETVNNSIPEFFRCDGDDPNPIMKAFCSTEGKGLACVIREMNLEGLTDVPWSVDKFDGRAPQLLTVAMEITPIHDISPGLDSRGFMTAPVWPTGTMVNNVMGRMVSSQEGLNNFARSRSRYFFSAFNKLGA